MNENTVKPYLKSIQNILNTVSEKHPGLVLDKIRDAFSNQKTQKEILQDVVQAFPNKNLKKTFESFKNRYKDMLSILQANTWEQTLISDLALHLSRANSLENAGICLHPIYGFPYLPGSGLKGMARAYAETVWLANSKDKEADKKKINYIFGFSDQTEQSAGAVVFHDAIPESDSQLFLDVGNCHYSKYYKGEELSLPFNAPGDWHLPELVYFLVMRKGSKFLFAISKRSPNISDEDLMLATIFLQSALSYNGAGAKTNSGYGYFSPPSDVIEQTTPEIENYREIQTFELLLETPGFFAGALQKKEDCELRPATLRGLLRWWWRTMYAGILTVQEMHDLETALWGSSKRGSAIQLIIKNFPNHEHEENVSKWNSRIEQINKYTHALNYFTYGTYQNNTSRFILLPDARWELTIITKGITVLRNESPINISAKDVLHQAIYALWLLTNFGGIGTKATKGFGSITANSNFKESILKEFENIKNASKQFIQKLGISNTYNPRNHHSLSFHKCEIKVEIPLKKQSWEEAIDLVETKYNNLASSYKHTTDKALLGLPKIDKREKVNYNNEFEFSYKINEKKIRYASPLRFHIFRKNREYYLNLILFEPPHLGRIRNSNIFLTNFFNTLINTIQTPALPPQTNTTSTSSSYSSIYPDGTFDVTLEKKEGDFWWAKYHKDDKLRKIINSEKVEKSKKKGHTVHVTQTIVNNEIVFKIVKK